MYDPIFLKYHLSNEHPESPDRVKYIYKELINNNFDNVILNFEKKNDLTTWVKQIHSNEHIRLIEQNYPLPHKVAFSAVNAALSGLDKIFDKKVESIFCPVRPPGHHALNTGREEGFCYYNTIAIAAKYAQIKYKIKKILIIDWDYHHGNSTEHMFYSDPNILFFSTHDLYAYPGTGDPKKIGEGKGKGLNVNIHLPCGTSDELILKTYKEILVPKVEAFMPELILISAGFDSRINDTLGCFEITDNGFIELTKLVMMMAEKFCNKRILSILEGGYNVKGNAKATIAHIKALNRLV
ncbi:MAG: histone deacetylase [Rickettsiales bacterium]|nr:histone deacetylase [Rickettsiales bacterium]|tara:strand:+ start:15089 stop:15976 length:888 start_codon:yes stop_codon:yes gene_type:complete